MSASGSTQELPAASPPGSPFRILPGATALTRTPFGPKSTATWWTRSQTPPLLAAYATCPGGPITVLRGDDHDPHLHLVVGSCSTTRRRRGACRGSTPRRSGHRSRPSPPRWSRAAPRRTHRRHPRCETINQPAAPLDGGGDEPIHVARPRGVRHEKCPALAEHVGDRSAFLAWLCPDTRPTTTKPLVGEAQGDRPARDRRHRR